MSSSGQQSCAQLALAATASPVSGVISRPYLARYTPTVTYRITLGTGPFTYLGLRLAARCGRGAAGASRPARGGPTPPAPAPSAGRMTSIGETF
jgi:hypothetical protein